MIKHKQFTHIEKPFIPELTRYMTPEGRKYRTPEGKSYPSVTTVLDRLNKEFLDKWKKRVGEEEAERIRKYAVSVGSPIHELFEAYIGNQNPDYQNIGDYLQMNMFLACKPYLDQIDNVLSQEQPLYSDVLQLAGTADLIAEYQGKKCIIDFKTSRRFKTAEEIKTYFMQTTIYSLMLEELTELVYPNIVIILVTYSGEVAVFERHRKDYYSEVYQLVHELYN